MFYIFSDEGITILQPGDCETHKRIKRTDRIVASYVSDPSKFRGLTANRH